MFVVQFLKYGNTVCIMYIVYDYILSIKLFLIHKLFKAKRFQIHQTKKLLNKYYIKT